jgi:hypothetical protein
VSNTRTNTAIYGPYLAAIPAGTVGITKYQTGVATASAGGIAWIYDPATGAIRVNTTTEADATGRLYSTY